ncbi:hypothetical protein CO083_06520 [Candidatus Roizmanbacteria bacterium CG_4_9_14_0_8_um_filter_34_12]|uniref:Uncharacterized protein n=1 Tax=Candidatus Roizmanbacteria bacterium CG_4_9_14_0_8_um_filter_34_12 TaxID=1974840 RepID=A0A2M8DAT5_9BACT|nr:MAG: hypothetical protein CO083_06520 [Candidatus Roizmanbacteria bacterium CG_4_9_14_0_8_um_filter_34_12]
MVISWLVTFLIRILNLLLNKEKMLLMSKISCAALVVAGKNANIFLCVMAAKQGISSLNMARPTQQKPRFVETRKRD